MCVEVRDEQGTGGDARVYIVRLGVVRREERRCGNVYAGALAQFL